MCYNLFIMDYISLLPLVSIPLFFFLAIAFFVCLLRRKWLLSIIILTLSILTNLYFEIISFRGLFCHHEERSDIIVLAYNVHTFSKDYKQKQEAIANEILSVSPDIAFLCEFVLRNNIQLDSILTNNGYMQSYIKGGDCVFYCKYPVDSIVGIRKKESKNKYSLNNKTHVFIGEDTLTIVGCHLSSSNHHIMQGYRNRENVANIIYESIKDDRFPMILLGDLNDFSGSYAIERIKDVGLVDAWWMGGVGYGATFCDKWLRLRLDHILYRKSMLELQYVKVIDSDLSDHRALVAGFNFKR